MQAKAQGYSRDSKQFTVMQMVLPAMCTSSILKIRTQSESWFTVIRHYGWRIQILSMFPSITEIEMTDSSSQPFPIFNAILFSSLAVLP